MTNQSTQEYFIKITFKNVFNLFLDSSIHAYTVSWAKLPKFLLLLSFLHPPSYFRSLFFLHNSLDTINASCMVMGVEGIYQGPAQQKNDAPTAFNCQ